MSRHGYVDDIEDELAAGRWRGAVLSAIRGKRGQAFLRELRDALDAMPVKALIAEELVDEAGEVCALGAVACARKLDVSKIDPEDYEQVAKAFGINEKLAREIMYHNDGWYGSQARPEARWKHVREWVEKQIKPEQVSQ